MGPALRVNAGVPAPRRLGWDYGDTYFPLAVVRKENHIFRKVPRDDVEEEERS